MNSDHWSTSPRRIRSVRTSHAAAAFLLSALALSACEQSRDRGADMAECRLKLSERPESNHVYDDMNVQTWQDETARANFLVDCMRVRGWEFTTDQCRVRTATGDAADRAAAASGYAAQAISEGCYRKAVAKS